MKICTKCKLMKSYFSSNSETKDKLGSWCKDCLKCVPTRTKGTLQYFKRVTWTSLNQRTINGSSPAWKNAKDRKYLDQGIELKFSKDEFYSWCDLQSKIIMDLYAKGKTPSIDRFGEEKHYTLKNIRIIDLIKNCSLGAHKSNLSRMRRIRAKHVKSGEELVFNAIIDVEKSGFKKQVVWCALNGHKKTYRGYEWQYAR